MKSSPFSKDAGPVRVRVTTGSPVAEVFLIDRSFVLVERSIEDLGREVPQGVYKVKARLGDVTTEAWHVLDRNTEIDLSGELSIASPAPLFGTTRTHEYHAYPAAEESRDVAVAVGQGAQIFLCARRWSGAPVGAARLSEAPPVSLHQPDGTTIADLGDGPAGPSDLDAMHGITVAVDPGMSLVRWRTDSGALAEQTVVAIREWQTQVFLLEEQQAPGAGPIADDPLEGVSVQMTRGPFDPDDPVLKISEHARVALASERPVASYINEALFAKFDNPMTGLFGAHLMLLAEERLDRVAKEENRRRLDTMPTQAPVTFDQNLYDQAVTNLVDLLGLDHPDVTALATRASDRRLQDLEPVLLPPMLWRSWILLIEASNQRSELVPVSTWQRTLTLLPVRPFLVWSPDGGAMLETWKREVAPLLRASTESPQALGGGPAAMAAPAPAPAAAGADEARRLSVQLLAPRAALNQLAGSLSD